MSDSKPVCLRVPWVSPLHNLRWVSLPRSHHRRTAVADAGTSPRWLFVFVFYRARWASRALRRASCGSSAADMQICIMAAWRTGCARVHSHERRGRGRWATAPSPAAREQHPAAETGQDTAQRTGSGRSDNRFRFIVASDARVSRLRYKARGRGASRGSRRGSKPSRLPGRRGRRPWKAPRARRGRRCAWRPACAAPAGALARAPP